jgi:hypothetical protein
MLFMTIFSAPQQDFTYIATSDFNAYQSVITTTDRRQGEVVIQTTTDCWPDLRAALAAMPFAIEIEEGQ